MQIRGEKYVEEPVNHDFDNDFVDNVAKAYRSKFLKDGGSSNSGDEGNESFRHRRVKITSRNDIIDKAKNFHHPPCADMC